VTPRAAISSAVCPREGRGRNRLRSKVVILPDIFILLLNVFYFLKDVILDEIHVKVDSDFPYSITR
jgi:hypothetical protein